MRLLSASKNLDPDNPEICTSHGDCSSADAGSQTSHSMERELRERERVLAYIIFNLQQRWKNMRSIESSQSYMSDHRRGICKQSRGDWLISDPTEGSQYRYRNNLDGETRCPQDMHWMQYFSTVAVVAIAASIAYRLRSAHHFGTDSMASTRTAGKQWADGPILMIKMPMFETEKVSKIPPKKRCIRKHSTSVS